jgi:Periplasmic binding protein
MRTRSRRLAVSPWVAVAAVVTVALAVSVGAMATTLKTVPPVSYAAYVGAKGKANKKLKPFVIGWINGQGSTVPGQSFPSTTRAAEAIVKLINAELGGVWGHPVVLNECFIVSKEEEGTKCGQQMANDKRVKVVAHGVVVTGNQSEYNVLKGSKPVVMGVSANNADVKAKNVFSLIGTSTSVLSSFGPYARKLYPRARTVAIVYPNDPGADVAAKAAGTSYAKSGLKATLVPHASAASDLVGTATQANGYDLIHAACNFGDCALLAKGLAQIRSTKPVVTPPLAIFIPFAAYPGGDFPKWDVGIAQSFLFDPSDPQIKVFTKKAAQYGLSAADQKDAFAELAWTTFLAIIKIANTVPYNKITSAKIVAGFKLFRGPLVMAAPNVACGRIDPTQPAACAEQAQFYRYQGKGAWKKTSTWLPVD